MICAKQYYTEEEGGHTEFHREIKQYSSLCVTLWFLCGTLCNI